MTSRIRSDRAMLMERKPSSRNGPTGNIIRRMVPNRPTVNSRSPLRNKRLRLDLGSAATALIESKKIRWPMPTTKAHLPRRHGTGSDVQAIAAGQIGPSRRQILLTIIAVGVDPVDVSEDLGHRHVELSRN